MVYYFHSLNLPLLLPNIFWFFVFPFEPFLVSFALLSYSICGFSPRMYLLTYDLQTQKSIILCIS